jgi:hypothetical protein
VLLEESIADVLDERVKSDVFLVELAGHSQRDVGKAGARRGDAGGAEDGEGQRFACARGVGDAVGEAELSQAVEAFAVVKMVQLDLQRSPKQARRQRKGGVALVADADVLERLALGRELGVRPGEFRAGAFMEFERIRARFLRLLFWAAEHHAAANRLHGRPLLGGEFEMKLVHLG